MNKTDLLLQVVEDVEFYRDKNDREIFYVEFENNEGKREFTVLDSESFKSFLYVKSYEITEGKSELEPDRAVKKLRFLLLFHKCYQDTTVFVRTSGNLTDGIEYDLQNDSQDTVKVTEKGWHTSSKKRRFVIPKVSLPQVTPIKTDKTPLELLKPFVNIKGDTYILFVIWLIQTFSLGTKYALWISADKGSGKTTTSKIIKRLSDPCNFDVTTIPEKKDDLHILLYNSSVCCFDNLNNKSLSNDVSDLFCGAITGTAIAKRSLFTNKDLTMATLRNTIVINGIDVAPARADLAQRMLLVKMSTLTSTNRRTESEFWGAFKEAKPEILGSIFNTLSVAMQKMKNLQTNSIARIGDAFVEMLAIAQALGISEERFRQIFDDNKEALEKARSTSPLIESVKEIMISLPSRKLQGSANFIFKKVHDKFSGDKSLLPQSASHFTRQLEKEHGNLLKNGFRVNIDDTGAQGTQLSIIKKK